MTRLSSALFCTALVAGALASAPPAQSAQVAGVTLPPTETVQGTQLQLAGCAAREELWTNLYAVAFYVPPGAAGAAAMTSGGTPKVIRLDVTYDGNVPDGLPSTWKDALQAHVSQEFLRTMHGLYDGLKGGDTVRVAYLPGQGTTVSVKGRTVASQPGDAAVNAMVNLWIGADPVSGNMKQRLLSGTC